MLPAGSSDASGSDVFQSLGLRLKKEPEQAQQFSPLLFIKNRSNGHVLRELQYWEPLCDPSF